jgi:hypothetical protein
MGPDTESCRPRVESGNHDTGNVVNSVNHSLDAAAFWRRMSAAVAAAERGWHVFPIEPGGKHPLVDRWEQRATANPGYARDAWTKRFPRANVGVACGPSGLVVLDLDTHGELPDEWTTMPGITDGRDVFAQLCEWAGQPLPVTYWVTTPRAGWHYYFRAPDGIEIRKGKLAPMVDVQAAGGCVLAAGSVVGGREYEVLDNRPPAPLPQWIIAELTRPPAAARSVPPRAGTADPDRRLAGLARTVEQALEGSRNQTLNWASWQARELVAQGVDRDGVADLLIAAACTAGLPEAEARRTVASGLGV